ncbi:bifunctional hydroxymethylpyrimidine kinase/phosphomethylpyrimidine kinase [Radiobacillus kanasensis]|uniref:bifunctional hydroxymethylpyrimidine kinase/phosphomethylpyrimidine kinase n=1 Tax=Radiobacillus kanasensis TaxID=2844358 RepID=UPI001E3C0013|nr:bifunctional hydroxymethylpyrimidine kinase/phosphomethylpyrimidine kinase [Radiobacillus kanasensis]UFT99732.1 bifunctional hydroxymethylpyrimidine kinase/phosphomethylpyrimidine kinase [Radiobacillus kanasensis]
MTIATALSIAGSAAHGSAGIQADLKTFQERDVYGMAAITAIVAKNPVTDSSIFKQSVEAIQAQFYTATKNVGADALKTGMLFSTEIIECVVDLLEKERDKPLVVDPVMIGKMGSQLLHDDAINVMKEKLFPLATIITPNRFEAAKLTGKEKLSTIEELKDAAKALHQFGPSFVVVKGGSIGDEAIDILYDGHLCIELSEKSVDTIHTSGAGCSFSAAITAELAKGETVQHSVDLAKKYVTAAIHHALSFGKGVGSTYHAAYRKYSNL